MGPCSWKPRRTGQEWRAGVSSGVWSPGRPGRGVPEGGEGAALSGLEVEVEACLCVWLQSGVEAGVNGRVISQRCEDTHPCADEHLTLTRCQWIRVLVRGLDHQFLCYMHTNYYCDTNIKAVTFLELPHYCLIAELFDLKESAIA